MTGPLEAALMKAAQATADNQRSRHPQHHWVPVVRPAFERASPGPRVELFARRARFGWDYWGDESLGTATIPAGVRDAH
ncbi:MAG: hypothetical protein U0869_21885 [Chloroflexota bacterium]